MSSAAQTADWVFPVATDPMAHAQVRWHKGTLIAIAPTADSPVASGAEGDSATIVRVITPGFVNTHTHLEFSGYPVVQPIVGPAGGSMADWLAQVVALTRGPSKWSPAQRADLGVREALRFGTTSLIDSSATGASVSAIQSAGLRGNVLLEWFHPQHHLAIERLEHLAQQVVGMVEQASGSAGRLTVGVSPHSPFNVSPTAWRWLEQALAERLPGAHLPWQLHLAESADEVRWLAGQPAQTGQGIEGLHQSLLNATIQPAPVGLSPVGYMAHHGLLRRGLSAAHGIELSADEQALLADLGVGLAHCPRSNLLLHGKTASLRQTPLHWAIGLGTDSHLSTPDLDLRKEALAACEVHDWSVWQALECLTLGGAKVMGWADTIGQLSVGCEADVVLWRVPTQAPHDPAQVCFDLLNHGVVESVWVKGQAVYSDEGTEKAADAPFTLDSIIE
jgi:aminodeoxyfutalosine deaminase